MKVAVVILNWNGRRLLEQFLPSVVAFSEGTTIYVADNASTDDSISYIERTYPNIRIIRNNDNYGFARGYNVALKHVNEPILALVNSDIEVTEGWLQPIVQIFEANSDVAVVQPKIRDFKKKWAFEYAGAAGGYIDKFGYPYCRGRVFDTVEPDTGQYNDATDIFWASGACFFIRNTVYQSLGGFDASFFAHQEEIDLCWRVRNKGLRCCYSPDSVVYHVGGATLRQSDPKKTFLNFRNSLLMLTKNLPSQQLHTVLLARLLLDGAAGVQLLLRGQPRHSLAVIRAHFAFYGMFRQAFRKRSGKETAAYYNVKCIVCKYFLNGCRKFSELF